MNVLNVDMSHDPFRDDEKDMRHRRYKEAIRNDLSPFNTQIPLHIRNRTIFRKEMQMSPTYMQKGINMMNSPTLNFYKSLQKRSVLPSLRSTLV